jgi:hypothetical protein
VTPQNVAVAVNENCNLCETFATAYQFVITGDTELEFTKEGQKELKRIVREIRRLNDPDLSLEEIRTRLDGLIARLRVVLRTQLVPKREHGHDEDEGDDREGENPVLTTTGETQTEPTETTTTQSTPTETTTTEPVETGTTTTDTTQTETVPTQTTP